MSVLDTCADNRLALNISAKVESICRIVKSFGSTKVFGVLVYKYRCRQITHNKQRFSSFLVNYNGDGIIPFIVVLFLLVIKSKAESFAYLNHAKKYRNRCFCNSSISRRLVYDVG